MTVLHTGSTKKFSANWGSIFGGASGGAAKPAKPSAAAKSQASGDVKPKKKATAAVKKPVKSTKAKAKK